MLPIAEQTLRTELLVVGGGPSGILCALAAARQGARVTLIEKYGFLGGCATVSLALPLMSFHAGENQVVRGYAQELIDRIRDLGGTCGHFRDPITGSCTITPVDSEVYKYVAQELLLEAGVNLLYHTELLAVTRQEDKITEALVHTASGNVIIRADRYVDASGNGDLAFLAGEPMRTGRPSDGKTQPMTMVFKLTGVDRDEVIRYFQEHPGEVCLGEGITVKNLSDGPSLAIAGFFSKVSEAQAKGDFPTFRDRVLAFETNVPGEMTVNMSRVINKVPTRGFELSEGTIEGRRQIFQILKFLRAYVPGFAGARLTESAAQIGVRESRRLDGQFTLGQYDVIEGRTQPDCVALGCWPIDIHDPDGKQLTMVQMEPGTYYHIPYRCMLPRKTSNLLVTGRIISTTHEAFASSRTAPTCFALGQAAGIASVLSLQQKCAYADVPVNILQALLRETGQTLD